MTKTYRCNTMSLRKFRDFPYPPLLRRYLDIHRCRDDAVECSFDPPPEARPIKPILGFDPASDSLPKTGIVVRSCKNFGGLWRSIHKVVLPLAVCNYKRRRECFRCIYAFNHMSAWLHLV